MVALYHESSGLKFFEVAKCDCIKNNSSFLDVDNILFTKPWGELIFGELTDEDHSVHVEEYLRTHED